MVKPALGEAQNSDSLSFKREAISYSRAIKLIDAMPC